MLSKREPPVTRLAQKGWGVGEVGGATWKRGTNSPCTPDLPQRGTVGVGGSDRCPSAPGLVRGWEGTLGYAGARRKRVARQEGGMPRVDPVTCPVARDPRLHISGGGVKGVVWSSALQVIGGKGQREGGRTFPASLWLPRLCAKAGWRESHARRMGKRPPTYRAGPSLLCRPCCA